MRCLDLARQGGGFVKWEELKLLQLLQVPASNAPLDLDCLFVQSGSEVNVVVVEIRERKETHRLLDWKLVQRDKVRLLQVAGRLPELYYCLR